MAAKAKKETKRLQGIRVRSTRFELATRADGAAMPPGVCAQISMIVLVYGEEDAYGTRFLPGCLDKTRTEKLAAGKIKLFDDHTVEGAARRHIGVVRTLQDVGDQVLMTADVFDTAAGREAAEYCKAVLAAGAFTGASVGFWERAGEWAPDGETGDPWGSYEFSEIELDEISIEPTPAVEGTELLQARRAPERIRAVVELAVQTVGKAKVRAWIEEARDAAGAGTSSENGSAGEPENRGAETAEGVATMEERLAVVRRSYGPLTEG